jgi:Zn-dependent oligopeptidase
MGVIGIPLSVTEGDFGESLIQSSPSHFSPGILDLSSPDQIKILINQSIDHAHTDIAEIMAIPDDERTINNTLFRFEEIITRFDDQTLLYRFIADECDDPAIASEARNARDLRTLFLHDVYLNSKLASSFSRLIPMTELEQRLLNKHREKFYLAGLAPEVLEELTKLSLNLSVLEGQYLNNQANGSLSQNLILVPEIINTRHSIVRLFGYSTFAEYQVAHSGADANFTIIKNGLYDWFSPVIQLSHEEAKAILQVKKMSDPDATVVFDYEISSLQRNLREISPECSLVNNDISIPAQTAVIRTNQFLSSFLSLDISPLPMLRGCMDPISLFRIADSETGMTQAYYYLKIRTNNLGMSTGKTYYLRSGRIEDGKWIAPVSVIVLEVPTTSVSDSGQIQLSSSDIQVMFHEIGHMMRHSLTNTRYATLSSGTQEDTAYIEVLSILFEKIFLTPEVFHKIMGNGVKNADASSCSPLLQNLRSDGLAESGYSRAYTVFLSVLDLKLASDGTDFYSEYSRLYENITGFTSSSGGTDILANPAFFIGNAGMYWHYALDEAYAETILGELSDGNTLIPHAGERLLNEYFEPAGSLDTYEIIQNVTNKPLLV